MWPLVCLVTDLHIRLTGAALFLFPNSLLQAAARAQLAYSIKALIRLLPSPGGGGGAGL